MKPLTAPEINNYFGDADLFLIDLILKGHFREGSSILDAGCGAGRNLLFFLRGSFNLKAVDQNKNEVSTVNFLSRSLNKADVALRADIRELPFNSQTFDHILCHRVLHFASSEGDFQIMLNELHRVLKSTGHLMISMASTLGFEDYTKPVNGGIVSFPNGSRRFALNHELMARIRNNWQIHDCKTVIFHNEHAETTLLLQPS